MSTKPTNKQLHYKTNRSNNNYYLNSILFQRVKMGLIHSILPWTREGRVEGCVCVRVHTRRSPSHFKLLTLATCLQIIIIFLRVLWKIHVSQQQNTTTTKGEKTSDCLSHKSPICPVHVAGNNRWTCNTTGQHADFKSYRVQKHLEAKRGTCRQKFFYIPELGCKICRGLARKTFPSQSSYFYLSLPNALQK